MQLRQLLDPFGQGGRVGDSVTAVHRLRLVARELHGHGPGHARPLHVPDGGPAQVMEVHVAELRPLPRGPPRAVEIPDGLAVVVEDVGDDAALLALHRPGAGPLVLEDLPELGEGPEGERPALFVLRRVDADLPAVEIDVGPPERQTLTLAPRRSVNLRMIKGDSLYFPPFEVDGPAAQTMDASHLNSGSLILSIFRDN